MEGAIKQTSKALSQQTKDKFLMTSKQNFQKFVLIWDFNISALESNFGTLIILIDHHHQSWQMPGF